MNPVIIYVDDEPHNLTVFEAAMLPEWQVLTFDSPLKALDEMTKLSPFVIVSDQRMPGMVGVNFLEICKRTHPNAKRVLVTGYSEEDLVVESVRKAAVHDYIRKPWDVDDLTHRISKMVETFKLESELREKTDKLENQNKELREMSDELRKAKEKEEKFRKELEAWAPPFILTALFEEKIEFPIKRDLAVITFDIIESSKLHGVFVEGRSLRAIILEAFSESVIKHGGWRESHSGDSAYAHFGITKGTERPSESALAVASEFRLFLRNLTLKHNLNVECGVGLHIAKDCLINLHTIEINSPLGKVTQKSFDSTSTDIDLVHRIENLTHLLPGSNIAISEEFVQSLSSPIPGIVELGHYKLKGQQKLVKVFLKPSDKVNPQLLDYVKQQAVDPNDEGKSAA